MKLTKQEEKIIAIKRAVRDGRGVYCMRLKRKPQEKTCPKCNGKYWKRIDGVQFKCANCYGGKVSHSCPDSYIAKRIFDGDIKIPDYDEPIRFEGHKLDEIYITEKAAKAKAKKLTAKLKKGATQ